MRRRQMSIRAEDACIQWIEDFLRFQRDKAGQWRHPSEMASDEVNQYLTFLAVEGKVSASTRNQACSVFHPRAEGQPRKAQRSMKGDIESAGINRFEVGNERVLQRRVSPSLWPQSVRWRR